MNKMAYNYTANDYIFILQEDIMADLLNVLKDKLSGKNVKIVLL